MALTSKVEEFRTRADSCFRQAESCSTQLDKDHWLKLAEDWLKMAQNGFHPLAALGRIYSSLKVYALPLGKHAIRRAPFQSSADFPFVYWPARPMASWSFSHSMTCAGPEMRPSWETRKTR